jgi:hypothetical protein
MAILCRVAEIEFYPYSACAASAVWTQTLASCYNPVQACTSSYQLVQARTSSYKLLQAPTSSYKLLPAPTSSYQLVPGRTSSYQVVNSVAPVMLIVGEPHRLDKIEFYPYSACAAAWTLVSEPQSCIDPNLSQLLASTTTTTPPPPQPHSHPGPLACRASQLSRNPGSFLNRRLSTSIWISLQLRFQIVMDS